MSSSIAPECAACLQNDCEVHGAHEEVELYKDWASYDQTFIDTDAQRHAYMLMKGLNRDRKVEQDFTDGYLQVQSKKFAIHKCITGALSEYFEKLFSVPMQEKQQNVAKISDLTPRRLERLLEYVYMGHAGLTTENVCTTIEDAAYVQLTGLMKECSSFMRSNMNVDNCLLFRAYAKRHHAYKVVDKANFIISENVVKVIHHPDFKELPYDDVLQFLQTNNDQIPDEEVLACCENWINYDPESRTDHFASLLELVDFAFISSSFIRKRVQSEGELVMYPEYNARLLQELSERNDEEEAVRSGQFQPDKNVMVVGKSDSWIVNIRTQEKHLLRMPSTGRHGACAVKDGEKVVVFGGGCKRVPDEDEIESDAEQLRHAETCHLSSTIDWTAFPSLKCGRRYAGCAMLEGKYYVTGGEQNNRWIWQTCECYYPDRNDWEGHSTMLSARRSHGMVVLNGSLYVLGGWNREFLASVERYDQLMENWVLRSPMREARTGHGAVVLNDKIFAVGGSSRKDCLTAEMYCDATDQWTHITTPKVRRVKLSAFVHEGKIFVVGGLALPEDRDADEVECYDPITDLWSVKFRMKIQLRSSVLLV